MDEEDFDGNEIAILDHGHVVNFTLPYDANGCLYGLDKQPYQVDLWDNVRTYKDDLRKTFWNTARVLSFQGEQENIHSSTSFAISPRTLLGCVHAMSYQDREYRFSFNRHVSRGDIVSMAKLNPLFDGIEYDENCSKYGPDNIPSKVNRFLRTSLDFCFASTNQDIECKYWVPSTAIVNLQDIVCVIGYPMPPTLESVSKHYGNTRNDYLAKYNTMFEYNEKNISFGRVIDFNDRVIAISNSTWKEFNGGPCFLLREASNLCFIGICEQANTTLLSLMIETLLYLLITLVLSVNTLNTLNH